MKLLHILSIFLIGFIFTFMNVNAVPPVPNSITTKKPNAITTKKTSTQGKGRLLHVEKRNVRIADNGKFIVSDISD
jgi:hypothetical protein